MHVQPVSSNHRCVQDGGPLIKQSLEAVDEMNNVLELYQEVCLPPSKASPIVGDAHGICRSHTLQSAEFWQSIIHHANNTSRAVCLGHAPTLMICWSCTQQIVAPKNEEAAGAGSSTTGGAGPSSRPRLSASVSAGRATAATATATAGARKTSRTRSGPLDSVTNLGDVRKQPHPLPLSLSGLHMDTCMISLVQ